MTAEVTDRAVLAELWVSFVSVLCAYASAASLAAEEPGVTIEQTVESIVLRGPRRTVQLRFRPESDQGCWVAAGAGEPSQGTFALLLDGTLRWSRIGDKCEMDALAERLVTLVAE